MSSQSPDPFDHGTADVLPSSGPDTVTPYASDPTEPAPRSSGYNNPLAISSLVSGLASVVITFSCFCCGPLALVGGITSIVAIVLGVIALSQIKAGKGDGRGLAIAGIISGAVVVLLMLAGIAFFAVAQQQGNMNDFQWPPDGPVELNPGEPSGAPAPELDTEELQMEGLIPVDPDATPILVDPDATLIPVDPDATTSPSDTPAPAPGTPDNKPSPPPGN